MSTQFYTEDPQDTSQQVTGQQATRQGGNGPSWFRIWSVVIGTAVAAALVVLAAVTLSHSHSSQAPAPTGTPTSTSVPAQPTTPAQPTSPAQPTTPVTPVHPVQPSAAVVKLQQELGQLNYYEGSVDGIMGPQTVQAITYLQRDAHLPQTGQMNAATQAALASFLAHGNNQMNS
jgi:Putative peptidoglycan binding domain